MWKEQRARQLAFEQRRRYLTDAEWEQIRLLLAGSGWAGLELPKGVSGPSL